MNGVDLAIECADVWKKFRVYEHRSTTLKDKLISGKSVYETMWALQGIDLVVPVGTSIGIVGSNGSGKSTLLRVINGVLTPDRGSVRVNGSVSAMLELGIGFHPDQTGRENVFLSGVLMGRTRRELRARYDDIVEFAGIERFMDSPVKTYSTGMWARLAFALATSVDPDILIIDEVLAVGDEAFQARCRERIRQFAAEGRTIVLVSHSLAMIEELCTFAVWLDKGVVSGGGEVHAVADAYRKLIQAGFVSDPAVEREEAARDLRAL
jgi:ABC-type polysaccharide/polyol phosphate transport system ATPase subunit